MLSISIPVQFALHKKLLFIGPRRKGGKVRTILWTHTLLGHQEIDFINGMGEVGGPTSYYFIGPKISNGGHDGSLKLNKNMCVLHKELKLQ